MSIKNALMALLTLGPTYGAQLRAEFEARTGGTWPLNVGQVYTTLGRLERDGLVAGEGADAEGRIAYRLTDAGHAAVRGWWTTPVPRDDSARDELAIKLALAVTVPGVDVTALVQRQRTATLRHLQELTRAKRALPPATAPAELATALVLDRLIFAADAEARWLDHLETTLTRGGSRTPRPGVQAGAASGGAAPATDPSSPEPRSKGVR